MPTGIYKRKKMSQETKDKISLANSGKKLSQERINQMKIDNKKYSYEDSKQCENCGNLFFRENNYWGLHWVKRRFCSKKCKSVKLGVWNKGKKMPERSGINHHNFGKPVSDELKKLISKTMKQRVGEKHHFFGKKLEWMSGENNPRWVNDRTKLQRYSVDNLDRRSSMYRDWRINVYKRDNFKCKINNKDCDGRIEAHHILSWVKHPELRYDINNGITLCKHHHPRKRIEELQSVDLFKRLITK